MYKYILRLLSATLENFEFLAEKKNYQPMEVSRASNIFNTSRLSHHSVQRLRYFFSLFSLWLAKFLFNNSYVDLSVCDIYMMYMFAYCIWNSNLYDKINSIKDGKILGVTFTNRYYSLMFDSGNYGSISLDLEHHFTSLAEIMFTTRRLNIMIWSVNLKKVNSSFSRIFWLGIPMYAGKMQRSTRVMC